jgi:hypothetical protein
VTAGKETELAQLIEGVDVDHLGASPDRDKFGCLFSS